MDLVMKEWFDDDTLWESLDSFLFSVLRTPDKTAAEVEQIISLLQLQAGATILDLGCGPGRHTVELARRGFQVTGVDRTGSYLAAARRRADHLGADVELVQADMRRFSRAQAFDYALNLWTSFGYFDDANDDLKVLRNLRACLKSNGKLLLDTVGKETLARNFQPRHWHRHPEKAEYLLEERRVSEGWHSVETQWILIRDGQSKSFKFRLRLYSGAELSRSLFEAGFSAVQLYGSLNGVPYDNGAERLVAIAIA
jgi:SAM-dependent methyltransferase